MSKFKIGDKVVITNTQSALLSVDEKHFFIPAWSNDPNSKLAVVKGKQKKKHINYRIMH